MNPDTHPSGIIAIRDSLPIGSDPAIHTGLLYSLIQKRIRCGLWLECQYLHIPPKGSIKAVVPDIRANIPQHC